MSNLPAYAIALKNRRRSQQPQMNPGSRDSSLDSEPKGSRRRRDENAPDNDDGLFERTKAEAPRRSLPRQMSRKSADEGDALIEFSPMKPKRPAENLSNATEEMSSDHQQFSGISHTNDVRRLERENAELQAECRDLEEEIKSLQQQNRELVSDITAMKGDSYKTAQLSKALASAQREIDELRQIIQSKDANFASLDRDYKALENDYKRRYEMRSAESDALRVKQMEIVRLQKELDQYRTSSRLDEPAHDVRERIHPRAVPEEPVHVPPRSFGQVPAAMRDSLRFGVEDNPPRVEFDAPVTEMGERELKSRLAALTQEKEEKERKLNKAAPKGANLAHVRRQKEELDEEIIALNRQISKLRLELKRRDIY
jgi:chromosome segregation ATPase